MFTKRFNQVYKNTKEFFLSELYYRVTDFFDCLIERISRSYAYAKFGYMHYDFDALFLYSLMSFKLKRIHKCLKNDIAIQRDGDMKALEEAISVCDRLFMDNYEDKYLDILLNTKNIKKRLVIYNKIDNERNSDIDRLAEIFKKHLLTWWS